MRICVRAIQMEPKTGRGDINYVFFTQGALNTPLFILTDYEAGLLLDELKEQMDEEDDTKHENTFLKERMEKLQDDYEKRIEVYRSDAANAKLRTLDLKDKLAQVQGLLDTAEKENIDSGLLIASIRAELSRT